MLLIRNQNTCRCLFIWYWMRTWRSYISALFEGGPAGNCIAMIGNLEEKMMEWTFMGESAKPTLYTSPKSQQSEAIAYNCVWVFSNTETQVKIFTSIQIGYSSSIHILEMLCNFQISSCWLTDCTTLNLTITNKARFIHVGGLPRAFAMSTMFTITVFMPFPFPSTCK